MQEIIAEFGQLFSRYASHTAVIDPRGNRQWRYEEVEDLSSRLAGALRPLVKEGDRVAFLLGNAIEIALCYLACLQLKVTAVPVHTALHADEVKQTIAFADVKLVISNSAALEKFPQSGLCFLFGDDESCSVQGLLDMPRLSRDAFGKVNGDFLALIMFTSGSTGVPKAIPILFSCLMGHVLALKDTPLFGGESRYYNVLPMSYIGGIQLLLCYFASGSVFILDEAFSPRSMYRYWDTVIGQAADTLWLTPSMAAALVAVGLEEESLRPRIAAQVKRVVIAMGPISTEAKQRFEALFGVALQKSFGITETLLCCHWNDDLRTPLESVGKALPGVEVVVVDTQEKRVGAGEEGELRIGGKWVLPEYWRQPEITAVTFDAKGYFKTGDIGMMDAQGNVFITGRSKDMIKCGGLNVSPVEIEAMLCRMEGVKEAAVVGVADEAYGERIIAFVQLLPGAKLDAMAAVDFCRKHLTPQKVPAEVRLRDVLPMNAVGKIDKKALKAELVAEGGRT